MSSVTDPTSLFRLDGKVAIVDDFARIELYERGKRRVVKTGHDKGHAAQLAAFFKSIRDGGDLLVPFEQQVAVTRATLRAVESQRTGVTLPVEPRCFEARHRMDGKTI